jgi:hypothetical protein
MQPSGIKQTKSTSPTQPANSTNKATQNTGLSPKAKLALLATAGGITTVAGVYLSTTNPSPQGFSIFSSPAPEPSSTPLILLFTGFTGLVTTAISYFTDSCCFAKENDEGADELPEKSKREAKKDLPEGEAFDPADQQKEQESQVTSANPANSDKTEKKSKTTLRQQRNRDQKKLKGQDTKGKTEEVEKKAQVSEKKDAAFIANYKEKLELFKKSCTSEDKICLEKNQPSKIMAEFCVPLLLNGLEDETIDELSEYFFDHFLNEIELDNEINAELIGRAYHFFKTFHFNVMSKIAMRITPQNLVPAGYKQGQLLIYKNGERAQCYYKIVIDMLNFIKYPNREAPFDKNSDLYNNKQSDLKIKLKDETKLDLNKWESEMTSFRLEPEWKWLYKEKPEELLEKVKNEFWGTKEVNENLVTAINNLSLHLFFICFPNKNPKTLLEELALPSDQKGFFNPLNSSQEELAAKLGDFVYDVYTNADVNHELIIASVPAIFDKFRQFHKPGAVKIAYAYRWHEKFETIFKKVLEDPDLKFPFLNLCLEGANKSEYWRAIVESIWNASNLKDKAKYLMNCAKFHNEFCQNKLFESLKDCDSFKSHHAEIAQACAENLGTEKNQINRANAGWILITCTPNCANFSTISRLTLDSYMKANQCDTEDQFLQEVIKSLIGTGPIPEEDAAWFIKWFPVSYKENPEELLKNIRDEFNETKKMNKYLLQIINDISDHLKFIHYPLEKSKTRFNVLDRQEYPEEQEVALNPRHKKLAEELSELISDVVHEHHNPEFIPMLSKIITIFGAYPPGRVKIALSCADNYKPEDFKDFWVRRRITEACAHNLLTEENQICQVRKNWIFTPDPQESNWCTGNIYTRIDCPTADAFMKAYNCKTTDKFLDLVINSLNHTGPLSEEDANWCWHWFYDPETKVEKMKLDKRRTESASMAEETTPNPTLTLNG